MRAKEAYPQSLLGRRLSNLSHVGLDATKQQGNATKKAAQGRYLIRNE